MTTHDPPDGSIVHVELYSEDGESTRTFYEEVFDWSFEDVEGGGYTLANPPSPPNGGLLAAGEHMPPGTLAYLRVADATATCRAIEAAGGRVVREPFDVDGWGTMAVFEAPGGVVQAVWESERG